MKTSMPPQDSDQDDKRQYLRLPRPFRVQARELVFPIAKDPLIDSDCSDISRGGLCVESRSPLQVGTRLHVNVHVPRLNKFSSGFFKVYENDAEQYFQAIAEVMWVRPKGGRYLVGISFINVDNDLQAALGKLVEQAFREMEKK